MDPLDARPQLTTEDLLLIHNETCGAGYRTMQRKNTDYAGSSGDRPFRNFETSARVVGIPTEQGIMIRLCDKVQRLGVLLAEQRDPAVVEESIEDTVEDAINYLVILKAWLREARLRTAPAMVEDLQKLAAPYKVTGDVYQG